MTDGDLVTLTIDQKEVTVPKGTLLIRAAEQLGIEVPRFCDHAQFTSHRGVREFTTEFDADSVRHLAAATAASTGVFFGALASTRYGSKE